MPELEDWKAILKGTRPDQSIGLRKLHTTVVPHMSNDRMLRALRHLRAEGLATLTVRRKHPDGARITFYKTPLPPEKRDKVARGSYGPRVRDTTVFAVEKTFTVTGGSYTAKQLRTLARAVLNELGEL